MRELVAAVMLGVVLHPAYGAGFDCAFDTAFSHAADARPSMHQEMLVLSFVVTDSPDGKAIMVGTFGQGEVTMFTGAYAITFLEVTKAGNFTLTTIFLPAVGELYHAAHSRHIGMPGGGLATQFSGSCKAVP